MVNLFGFGSKDVDVLLFFCDELLLLLLSRERSTSSDVARRVRERF